MDNKEVGRRISHSRKAKGYSLRDLGEILGISHSTLSRWENGIVDKIPMGTFSDMAHLFGVDPLWLSGLDDVANRNPMDESTREVHFMADIMMACERFDNIGENFTDDDWKEVVAYIKMKAMMRNEKASE